MQVSICSKISHAQTQDLTRGLEQERCQPRHYQATPERGREPSQTIQDSEKYRQTVQSTGRPCHVRALARPRRLAPTRVGVGARAAELPQAFVRVHEEARTTSQATVRARTHTYRHSCVQAHYETHLEAYNTLMYTRYSRP